MPPISCSFSTKGEQHCPPVKTCFYPIPHHMLVMVREGKFVSKPSTRDIFLEGKTEGKKGKWMTYDPESYPLHATKPNQTAI
jgi:hypothetical protein